MCLHSFALLLPASQHCLPPTSSQLSTWPCFAAASCAGACHPPQRACSAGPQSHAGPRAAGHHCFRGDTLGGCAGKWRAPSSRRGLPPAGCFMSPHHIATMAGSHTLHDCMPCSPPRRLCPRWVPCCLVLPAHVSPLVFAVQIVSPEVQSRLLSMVLDGMQELVRLPPPCSRRQLLAPATAAIAAAATHLGCSGSRVLAPHISPELC